MAVPERMVPWKVEAVSVAAPAVRQYTLHASAVPAMSTVKLLPVRAPVPPVPILKTQISVADPLSVKTTPAPIVVPATEQQTPGASVVLVVGTTPSHVGFRLSSAPYAVSKSVTTVLGTGALIAPVIVHPLLVIELKVETTSPLMVDVAPTAPSGRGH